MPKVLQPSRLIRAPGTFANLADNLQTAWESPDVTMRVRQQLLRTLIEDIVVDVDDEVRDVVLTIHWKSGQHSELKVRKPQTGEHGCATTEDALAVMHSMAGRWSDEHIAASLNRMGMPMGQGKTWTAHRVASVRRVRAIHAYKSADKDGEWLTMTEARRFWEGVGHGIAELCIRHDLRRDVVEPCLLNASVHYRFQGIHHEIIIELQGPLSR